MKKIERLRFVENIFGKEFVLPYKICCDEEQITKAIREFESEGSTWGMRTDLSYGKNQGNLLPFVLKGNLSEALKVFEKYKKELVYIISHNILDYACNGVATPYNDEEIFFEINRRDNNSQRKMYDDPNNLEHFLIGQSRKALCDGIFYPCFKPEDNYPSDLRLSEIYNLLVGRKNIDEVTFSIRNPDKRIVIW